MVLYFFFTEKLGKIKNFNIHDHKYGTGSEFKKKIHHFNHAKHIYHT